MSGTVGYTGPCWRAAGPGLEGAVLGGSDRPGRYNRAGERTLYMSGSPEGVAAAMARYGDAPRRIVRLMVEADGLIDLRDAPFGFDASRAKEDWIAALDRGEEPPSWAVSDRARALGATGLIDGSRRLPDAWHLVLFRWNEPGGASVRVERDE